MTTATGDDYGRYRPWLAWLLRHTEWVRPGLMWTGHYILVLLGAYAGVVLATDLSGRPPVMAWIETGFWVAVLVLIVASISYHQAKLCERCMGGAPLDPQAAVTKWKPVLRLNHRNTLITVVLVANIAWQALVGNLVIAGVHAFGLPKHHETWAYLLQDLPSLVVLSGYFIADHIHRNLYPWCPWCHWGDGGEPEVVPDPDPALSKTG